MNLLAVVALAGGVALLASARSTAPVGWTRWRWSAVPVLALSADALAMHVHAAVRVLLVLGGQLVVIAWLAVHVRRTRGPQRRAMTTLATGSILNAVPMVRYGAMPVSAAGLRAAGGAGTVVSRGHLGKHLLSHGGLIAHLLGDVIPLAQVGAVISLGDIVLLGGLIVLASSALRTTGGARLRLA